MNLNDLRQLQEEKAKSDCLSSAVLKRQEATEEFTLRGCRTARGLHYRRMTWEGQPKRGEPLYSK